MTSITPAMPTTIRYTATLLSPLHHGAGTSGNTSLLRTQEVVQPDGSIARVPFLSAASVRHALRDRLAWHLARTLNLGEGALTKAAVDLLWTGGAVTKTGAETNLDLARRVEAIFPALAMLGYAALSDIISGTMRASDMILACRENAHRLPSGLPDSITSQRAAAYRAEEFGTRHDQASGPAARLIAVADDLLGGTTKTTQMIFDVQVLKAGSVLAGHVGLTAGATDAHRMVLGAALALWAPGGVAHLGAKTATGYGEARIEGLGDHSADLDAWTLHVSRHTDDILGIITELTS